MEKLHLALLFNSAQFSNEHSLYSAQISWIAWHDLHMQLLYILMQIIFQSIQVSF